MTSSPPSIHHYPFAHDFTIKIIGLILILDDWQISVNIFALRRLHSGIQVFDSLIFINIFALGCTVVSIQAYKYLIR